MKTPHLPVLGIVVVGVLAWFWLLRMGSAMPASDTMSDMAGMRSMDAMPMGPGALSLMWAVMMIAMMAPSAAPSYFLYARMSRQGLGSAAYLTGYLGAWGTAGIFYAIGHWGLQLAGLLNADMRLTSTPLAGALLVGVGAWQWSPMKARCVSRCRTPLGFLLNEWRDGALGALWMGTRYAGWCIGCCWLVMAVLFVAGAMSFVWAAAISAYVLAERVLPFGRTFDRVVGLGLMGWGVGLIGGAGAIVG